jgi:hypothetical protein
MVDVVPRITPLSGPAAASHPLRSCRCKNRVGAVDGRAHGLPRGTDYALQNHPKLRASPTDGWRSESSAPVRAFVAEVRALSGNTLSGLNPNAAGLRDEVGSTVRGSIFRVRELLLLTLFYPDAGSGGTAPGSNRYSACLLDGQAPSRSRSARALPNSQATRAELRVGSRFPGTPAPGNRSSSPRFATPSIVAGFPPTPSSFPPIFALCGWIERLMRLLRAPQEPALWLFFGKISG